MGQIINEVEKRKVRAELLALNYKLADMAMAVNDEETLIWIRDTMSSVCDIMREKTGTENDFAKKKFDLYVELKKNPDMTNKILAEKVGLCENSVRKIRA